MFHTEAVAPGNHPELSFKVPIMDLAVWMDSQELPAPGMDSQNVHSSSGTSGSSGTVYSQISHECRLAPQQKKR